MLGRTTKRSLGVGALFLTMAGLAALPSCSGSVDSAPASPDAASAGDAPVASEAGDAALASDADAAAPVEAAMMCDIGTKPTLPMLTSEILVEGSDGGTPPTPTGGDPTGIWVYTKITLYLPAAAAGQVDPSMSSIAGTGFVDLTAGKFRQFVDTTTVLATTALGKITRASTAKTLGTYVNAGTKLTFTPTCNEMTGQAAGTTSSIQFSRVDDTHGLLHVTTDTQLGTTILVIDLQK